MLPAASLARSPDRMSIPQMLFRRAGTAVRGGCIEKPFDARMVMQLADPALPNAVQGDPEK